LVYYSEIFNQAMKDKPWNERIYFELFAGPGRCFVRETEKEQPGSPLQVLDANFTKYIFVEMNKEGAMALATRIGKHPNASKVEIWCGDCAEAIEKIVIPPRSLTFTFIDPTRIGHAPFKLITTLVSKARSDILLNIPTGTDIKRNWRTYLNQTGSDEAIADINPVTIFHEPINIRAENVGRIQSHADELGVDLKTDVFETREQWQNYAVNALQTVERLSEEIGIADRLHLWPDKSLGNLTVANRMPKPRDYMRWLRKSWTRISEWPR
jgi:three-Cys-motif partner protein